MYGWFDLRHQIYFIECVETFDVFYTLDEIYLVFTEIKVNVLFIIYKIHGHFSIEETDVENAEI